MWNKIINVQLILCQNQRTVTGPLDIVDMVHGDWIISGSCPKCIDAHCSWFVNKGTFGTL